jgi:hypothetical protein
MVYWPEETPNNNPNSLARFKPEPIDIGDVPGGSTMVTIKTNLAGEPVRFTLNEQMDSIVMTANLVMINAVIGDNNQIQQGVMGPTPTEEDWARWGTLYQNSCIEPNQLVEVYELRGPYTTYDPGEDYTPIYYTALDINKDYSLWRVVDVVSYTDDNDVPYYEVNLESLGQKLIEAKVDPKLMGSAQDWVVWMERKYYDDLVYYANKYMGQDGYNGEDSPAELNAVFDGCRQVYDESILVAEGTPYEQTVYLGLIPHLVYYIEQHVMEDFSYMAFPYRWSPAVKQYNKGDSLWDSLSDLLSFNLMIGRFNHDCSTFYTYNPDDPDQTPGELRKVIDVGNFGKGVKYTYSKAGVCDIAKVTGYIGVKDADGHWIPFASANVDDQLLTTLTVTCDAATNILNGEHVETEIAVDADHWLTDIEALRNYGKTQLYKTVLAARGASYDSEGLPLNLQVGQTIIGTSQVGGTTAILITSLSRTTDAQLGTITTSISGTLGSQTGSPGANPEIGWT